jgi:hypothetical protein
MNHYVATLGITPSRFKETLHVVNGIIKTLLLFSSSLEPSWQPMPDSLICNISLIAKNNGGVVVRVTYGTSHTLIHSSHAQIAVIGLTGNASQEFDPS